MIRYADITINDRNPLKRKLQRIRLRHALKVLEKEKTDFSGKILDFGSGDATLDLQILKRLPACRIVSYEPVDELRDQARANTAGFRQIELAGDIRIFPHRTFDYIFCLEVLEHLTESATSQALSDIHRLSHAGTRIVIGIPNEIFLAALLKGLFRLTRRAGDVDARPGNILRAMLGKPIPLRPVGELSPGVSYIFRHIGFDHRKLIPALKHKFIIRDSYGSPFPKLPFFFNFELYLICEIKIG